VAKFLFGGFRLIISKAFMGIKLCGRQVSRTNEHEFEVQETSNKAVASVLENLLRDHFAWIAITATAIRRRMDLLLYMEWRECSTPPCSVFSRRCPLSWSIC